MKTTLNNIYDLRNIINAELRRNNLSVNVFVGRDWEDNETVITLLTEGFEAQHQEALNLTRELLNQYTEDFIGIGHRCWVKGDMRGNYKTHYNFAVELK